MILGQTIVYHRQHNKFTTADQCGAMVAHHDLVRAALNCADIDGVHFFSSNHWPKANANGFSLAELQREFPQKRVERKDILELPALASQSDYVLPVEIDAFPLLAVARQNFGLARLPLCGVIHSISSQLSAMENLFLVLLAAKGDRIVVSSESGFRAVTTLFQDTGEFLMSRLRCPAISMPVIVKIPFGVDEVFLHPVNRSQARAKLQLPQEGTILLYVGRLTERSKADLEPLLISLRRLTKLGRTVYLVVAGSDSRDQYANRLSALVGQLGLQKHVFLRPNFAFESKPLIYSSADIFISPVDNIQETFGLSLLEAAACGLPVVASDWSGYRDLVAHEHTGFLVPTVWNGDLARDLSAQVPLGKHMHTLYLLAQNTVVDTDALTNYLSQLICNPNLCQLMGDRGQQRVLSQFRWCTIIQQYKELWLQQREEVAQQSVGQPRVLYDLQRIFGHFASRNLDPEATLLEASDDRQGELQFQDHIFKTNANGDAVERLLHLCCRKPQSANDLISSGNLEEGRSFALAWLWKKAYLRVHQAS